MFAKQKNFRSEKYLAWVRSQPCCHCGKPADHAHHLIGIGQMGGMGMKAPDVMTMPLCAECHNEMHHNKSLQAYQWEAICQTLAKAANEGVIGAA